MKKTYLEILTFKNTAKTLRGDSKVPLTKFHWAIDRINSHIDKVCKTVDENYNADCYKEKVNLASVDEKNNLIYDANGNFSYTIANNKALYDKLSELQTARNNSLIEIEPYMATHIPELSLQEIEALKGFVIPQEYEITEPQD